MVNDSQLMKLRVLLLIFALVVLARPVSAQSEPKLESLEISLWPEFDRPDMLVIYRGLLSAGTDLPAAVEFRIPARVGEPTAVAYVDAQGQRLNQQYTTSVDGEWLVVAFELPAQGFQLEYYDPLSVDADGKRSFGFLLVADYDVATLGLEFQVPPTAQEFALDPPADSVTQQADGLTYHLSTVASLERGQERSWTVSYVKSDAGTTSDLLFAEQTPSAPAAEVGANDSVAPIILGGFVALVATGAAGFWLGRRTQPPAPVPAASRPRRRGSGRGSPSMGAEASLRGSQPAQFCHRCGTALRPDGEFCQGCGAEVRRD